MIRGYSNTTIYLGVGLIISALVIFYLLYFKSSSPPPEAPRSIPRPPPQQAQRPQPPPILKNPQGSPDGYGGRPDGYGQPLTGPGGRPPGGYPQGNPQNMESFVGSGKPALVLFYSNGCGHSRNMRPAWDQAKQQLDQSGQVDAILIEDQAEIQKCGVRGFPTVRMYPEGYPSQNFIEYQGNRSIESLITFARSKGQQV